MSERFKVGDRVAAVHECSKYYPAGALGTVFEVHDSDYQVEFDKAEGVYINADCGSVWFVTALVAAPVTCKVSEHKAEYRARANDPATSKGPRKVNKYEQAVLSCLASGPKTGKEMVAICGFPLNSITPRFAPLRRKELIKDSGVKRDKQIVWVLA